MIPQIKVSKAKVITARLALYLLVLGVVATSAFGQVEELAGQPAYNIRSQVSIKARTSMNVFMFVDKSYECSFSDQQFNTGGTDSYFVFQTLVGDPQGGFRLATANGHIYPQISGPTEITSGTRTFARLSFIPVNTGNHTFTFSEPTGQNMQAFF